MSKAQRKSDTRAVLRTVDTHRSRLADLADAVRADEPDAVHQMRVSARRLRSVLGTYRSLFPRDEAQPVRDELKWLGSVLGAARDEEVLAARFEELLDAQAPDLVRGTVRYRLVTAHREGYREAHADAVAVLAGERYRELLTLLDILYGEAESVGAGAVGKELRKSRRKVLKAGASAGLGGADPGPADALHATRKRAKALRYAAEAVTDSRKSAKKVARGAEDLQTVLGDFQDAVVARARILDTADRARAAGEDTFTYGVIAAAEQARQHRAVTAACTVLAVVRKRSV
ncbi:CHAD domain-containing protein [Rhodococcus sp. NPDC003318]|uniref:CHAD domain-containing protein n=1 Tax=Rhodococcus sp. NPDC003318 TaxID=3364503 RepID=UPI003687FD04